MLQSKCTEERAIHQLCIRPTGGSKSLLFTTLAACLGRITLCITPLLSLGADQTIKHQHNTITKSTELNSLHLDKVPKDVQLILNLLLGTVPSSSILVYTSPQSLITKATGRSAFLKFLLLGNHHLLSMIVTIDKIYLLNDFGRLFWPEINMLKDELFDKVKETKLMLFLTMTCMKSVQFLFETLIGVKCNSLHWPSHLEMTNQKVRIEVMYTQL